VTERHPIQFLPPSDVSPLLLVLVHAHSPWTQRHHVQQPPDHRQDLEEVVLHEVPHDPVARDRPERVQDDVERGQEDNQDQRCQFGLVADGNTDHEGGAHDQEEDVDERELEVEESEEHDDEKDAAGQLHVVLLLVASQAGHARIHGLHLPTHLRHEENQTARQGHVPERTEGGGLMWVGVNGWGHDGKPREED